MVSPKVISVVTPCYNEEGNVRACYERVRAVFDEHLPDYQREHLFCDNCSTDKTLSILKEIAATDPCVRIIANARNFGIVRSGYNGIINAGGDATFLFMPADLQDPPELMPEFVRLWEEGYDFVYGIRADREEGGLMKFVRGAYYWLIDRISPLNMPLNVGDYQLVDRHVLDAMRQSHDLYPYVRVMAFQCTSNSIGIPYTWARRENGISKNRLINLIDQGLNGIISVSPVPTRVALMLGSLLAAFSVLYGLWTAIGSLIFGTPAQPGITTIICGLFMLNGLVLFFVGLIGEYVMAIHTHVRHKPLIVERERINFPDITTRTKRSTGKSRKQVVKETA